MHLETLRLYCDVVRLRSFSKGAEQNFVSQSAASQAVQQLESQERPGRGASVVVHVGTLRHLAEADRPELCLGSAP